MKYEIKFNFSEPYIKKNCKRCGCKLIGKTSVNFCPNFIDAVFCKSCVEEKLPQLFDEYSIEPKTEEEKIQRKNEMNSFLSEMNKIDSEGLATKEKQEKDAIISLYPLAAFIFIIILGVGIMLKASSIVVVAFIFGLFSVLCIENGVKHVKENLKIEEKSEDDARRKMIEEFDRYLSMSNKEKIKYHEDNLKQLEAAKGLIGKQYALTQGLPLLCPQCKCSASWDLFDTEKKHSFDSAYSVMGATTVFTKSEMKRKFRCRNCGHVIIKG